MKKDLNRSHLVDILVRENNMKKKEATKVIETVFGSIEGALKDGKKVKLTGFGNFEVRERSARRGRNPQTGEEISIPASRVPAFKPGKGLKNVVN